MEEELSVFKAKISSFDINDQERILKALQLVQKPSLGPSTILLELGLDADTIIASLILSCFYDTPAPESFIHQVSETAATLVTGVKRINKLRTSSKTIQEAFNIRNMLLALTDDIRVIFIKLTEKLHFMRVLDSSREDDRKTIARECLDIYAPLADRLGISWIKDELEDLSLKILNREIYQQIKNLVAQKRDQRNLFLDHVQDIIRAELEAAGINAMVESRAKHFYSIYMKMRKRGKSAEEIYDLSGIRIICDSIETCYTLLGIVHSLWKPLNGCFKDYIARPKPNGYRSLHTTVIVESGSDGEQASDAEGRFLEIQIRSSEMHQIAENGVASHWLYKKGSSRDVVQEQDINIINKLRGWKQSDQNTSEASGSWLEGIKQEILHNWVYVFTPQGNVVKLPAGATPIDFAYQIHTAIGEHCNGAKANGNIIPLNSQLKNTQVIEILTSTAAHPHLNWLQIAKSSKARSKIKSWLEKNDEFHSTEKTLDLKKKPAPEPQDVPIIPEKRSMVQKVIHPLSSVLQVRIEDEKNLMIRFARCCNPVTGDSIIGYVSRGRGIIIHRKNCTCLANNPEFENRKIDAEWENEKSTLVKRFKIEAKYSANLFSEIEGAIRKRQGHLIEGRLEENASNRLSGAFTMQLLKAEDLKAVTKSIRGIPGILGIQTIN